MNPIIAWRAQRQWSRQDVAIAAGISYGAVEACERGRATRLHPRLLMLVAQLDGDETSQCLIHDWAEWKRRLQADLLKRVAL